MIRSLINKMRDKVVQPEKKQEAEELKAEIIQSSKSVAATFNVINDTIRETTTYKLAVVTGRVKR